MHLLIDNYDSFTYNVVQLLGELGAPVLVRRNDRITLAEACDLAPLSLLVSPGPGAPQDAGVSMELIRHFAGRIPVLGICLGHQCLVQAFGGVIGRAPQVMHGKASWIRHDGKTIYEGLPNPFAAGRYHSLAADEDSLPAELQVSARTPDGQIMGVRLQGTATEGVQFHPESILTIEGRRLLGNFLRRTGREQAGSRKRSAGPGG